MKKSFALFIAVVMLCFVVSAAFAADKLVSIKAVDENTRTIVLAADGQEHMLKADNNVDIARIKPGDVVRLKTDEGLHLGAYNSGDRVEFEFVKGILMSIKFQKVKGIK